MQARKKRAYTHRKCARKKKLQKTDKHIQSGRSSLFFLFCFICIKTLNIYKKKIINFESKYKKSGWGWPTYTYGAAACAFQE